MFESLLSSPSKVAQKIKGRVRSSVWERRARVMTPRLSFVNGEENGLCIFTTQTVTTFKGKRNQQDVTSEVNELYLKKSTKKQKQNKNVESHKARKEKKTANCYEQTPPPSPTDSTELLITAKSKERENKTHIVLIVFTYTKTLQPDSLNVQHKTNSFDFHRNPNTENHVWATFRTFSRRNKWNWKGLQLCNTFDQSL